MQSSKDLDALPVNVLATKKELIQLLSLNLYEYIHQYRCKYSALHPYELVTTSTSLLHSMRATLSMLVLVLALNTVVM